MHEEPRRRDCTEETPFDEGKTALLQQLHLTAQQFDEAYLEGFHASVGLNPASGEQIVGSDLFIYITINAQRFPSLRIGYTFDDTTIHLWHVDVNPAGNGQEN